jgi:transposase-like protein
MNIQCNHCGSTNYRKNGSYKGVQRYVCKECKRAFSDEVRKFTYADKERAIFMYLNNVGIRKVALFMGCAPSLVIKWIREAASNLRRSLRAAEECLKDNLPETVEMDEVYTRIKKGVIAHQYGLLLVGTEVKLLHLQLEKAVKKR